MKKDDIQLLKQTEKFCSHIDKYYGLLDLDIAEVENLKNEYLLMDQVFLRTTDDSQCIDNFLQVKIQNMRLSLSHLAKSCKNNRNYSIAIGLDLGIELPVNAFLAN